MIKRTILKDLKNHLNNKQITLITGPRQAGKTTLMLILKKGLDKKRAKTVFFNLDIEQDWQYFLSQQSLIDKIRLEIGQNKGYVFIDEIQRKKNAGLFLKGLYDLNLPYKLIVSGSGSLELKEKIHESLAGRKRIFKLNTLSFNEFVNFKTNYKYQNKLSDFFKLEKDKKQSLLKEYLNFGGYPKVVLETKLTEKQKEINEIYQAYVEKDITHLLQVKKTSSFSKLVQLMAWQIGKITNLSQISSSLGLSVKTGKEYLWYLEKTFIIKKVAPFFKNTKKEIIKSPVYYFTDLGLRNHSLGLLGNIQTPPDFSFLFQNFVFSLLTEKFDYQPIKINFWRTKDGAEVDFIINTGQQLTACEVKYQNLPQPKISRSLISFIKKYQPEKALVVNLSLDQKITIDKTKVEFIPFYKIKL